MAGRHAVGAATEGSAKEKGLWSYLAAGISAGLLLVVVGIAVAVIIVPWATNSVALTVLTRSMEPAYPPGTLVIVKPVEPEEIAIGDVITYQIQSGEAEYLTHRVVAISRTTGGELSFTTKGDNNSQADAEPVREVQVQGRLWYSLPWIGYLNTAVGGGGKTWLVIGGAVALFAYAGWQFTSSLFDASDRRKRRRDAASAD